jgi:hypothetical protein
MDLSSDISPPKNEVYIDPVRGIFILPRPSYWSRCEDEVNLSNNADIKTGNPIFTKELFNNGSIEFIDVKINKGLQVYGGSGDGYRSRATLEFSNTNNNYNSFTASFFLKTISHWISVSTWNSAEFSLYFGNLKIFVFNRDTHTIEIKIDNIKENSHSFTMNQLQHIYVIGDNNGIDGSQDTVRIYVDNTLFCSTTENYNATSCIPELFAETYAGDSPYHSDVIIDNIKIWDYVVSEDPSWIYDYENAIDATDDALHPVYGDYGADSTSDDYKPKNVQVGYYYY